MKNKIGSLIFLHVILIIYSAVSVLSKVASTHEFLSAPFIIYYGLMVVCLGIYAILWQQVLKRIPLGIAFANKAVVIIWGILWGKLFFDEAITLKMLIGAAVIIVGIILVVTDKEEEES